MSSTLSATAAENNLSAEILLGTADQELLGSNINIPSGDDTSFGVRGSLLINKNLSIEASYQNYGEANVTFVDGFGDTINDKLSSTAMNIGAKGFFTLDNEVSLNARLGLSFWNAELNETDSSLPGEILNVNDSGNDFYYGIGIQYSINSNMFIGAEYIVTPMGV